MSPDNPYEDLNRERKAHRLAAQLLMQRITRQEAQEFDQGQRRLVERAAQVRPASDLCWDIVVNSLPVEYETACRDCGRPVDPGLEALCSDCLIRHLSDHRSN